MAFTIFALDDGINKEYSWHINTQKPKINVKDWMTIIMLQADGDELELIIERFQNLPHCFHICTWRYEMAQFIYDNL